MSLTSTRNRITAAHKELRVRWERLQGEWDDDVRVAFEQEFVAPLDGNVRAGVTAIEKIESVVTRARRECE